MGHSKGSPKRKVYIMKSVYNEKSETSQINDLIVQLKLLENQE
jgi:hypothetical protein